MNKYSAFILQEDVGDYLKRIMPPRTALFAEIEEAARERGELASPELGKLLQCLCRGAQAQSILQIGVGSGYETLWLASGSQQLEISAIDEDREALELAAQLHSRAGNPGVFTALEGEAVRVLSTLDGVFDLVYINAAANQRRRCLDLVLPKVRVGGLVVLENLLLGGAIAAPPDAEVVVDEDILRAARAFNGYLMIHPQLSSVILPVARGVGIATKLKPLVTEMGGPF